MDAMIWRLKSLYQFFRDQLVMDISDNDQSDAEDNVVESQPDMSSLLCNPYQ